MEFKFARLSESLAAYDAFCELSPDKLNVFCLWLRNYDYEMDIYGSKPIGKISRPFLLSTRSAIKFERSWDLSMKPAELNIAEDIAGDQIRFGRTRDFARDQYVCTKETYNYYFDLVDHHFNAWRKLTRPNSPPKTS